MLNDVRRIAEEAGRVLLSYYKQKLDVSYKTDEFDPVTAADLAADQLIRERLTALYPDDQLLTEEQESTQAIDYTRRIWVVDPLDGTKYFVRERDEFSVSIGLLEQGRPVLGVVHVPVAQKTYAADATGAWLYDASGSRPLAVTQTARLDQVTDIVRMQLGEKKRFDTLVERFLEHTKARTIVGAGAAMKICMVAEGAADVLVNPSTDAKKWDTCAAHCILESAGGRISRFDGEPLDYTKESPVWDASYIATNGVLHKQLVAELHELITLEEGTHGTD